MTTFAGISTNVTDHYNITYDDERLEVFGDTQALQNLTSELDSATEQAESNSGFFDIVGGFISRAVSVLRLSKDSIGTFNRMASATTTNLGLPSFFLDTIIAIILVLFVIGIIVAVMVKWQL